MEFTVVLDGGFQLVMGVHQARWVVDFMENPNLEMDEDGGYPLDSGNHHMLLYPMTDQWYVWPF